MSKLSDGHQLIATLITFNFNVVDSINFSFGRFPNFSPWSNLFLETIRCSRHSNGGGDSSRLRPKMRVSRERDSERISRLICIWKRKLQLNGAALSTKGSRYTCKSVARFLVGRRMLLRSLESATRRGGTDASNGVPPTANQRPPSGHKKKTDANPLHRRNGLAPLRHPIFF